MKNILVAVMVASAAALAPMATFGADLVAPVPLDRPAFTETVTFDGLYISAGANVVGEEYTPRLAVGLDSRNDFVIVGGEVFANVSVDSVETVGLDTVGFDAKAGFVLTDNIAVYAIGGVEVDVDTAVARNSVGVGTDVLISDGIYATASYKQTYDFGTFDNPTDQFTAGLKFRF